ncbi:MAG: hypothetical protein RBR15_06960 [Sphaerochaeta sp.]|nr:hypothetical protein [Sphaerochaeta sp.]
MSKKILLLLGVLVLVVLLFGCEPSIEDDGPGIDFVLNDIIGTWEFPDQNGDSAISVEIFTSPTTGVFIYWTDGDYSYDCHGHGTLEDKVFSYTYGYYSLILPDGYTGPASDVVLEVTLTFTYKNDRLKVVCSGEGPLAGKVFTTGVLEIT